MLDLHSIVDGSRGDFWELSIDERDLELRCAAFGVGVEIPENELRDKKGGVVWRLMEELCDRGVVLTQLYEMGVLAFGFYGGKLYSDEWVQGVYRQFSECGGLEGVIAKLRVLGVPERLLTDLRIDFGDLSSDLTAKGVVDVLVNLSTLSEDAWYNQLALLLSDAKQAWVKGFNTRKEVLMLVGKKKGFISQEFGEGAVAVFINGLTAKGVSIVEQLEKGRLIEVKAEDVKDE